MRTRQVIIGIFIMLGFFYQANSQDVRGKRIIADQSFYLKHWIDSIANDTTHLGSKTVLTAKAIVDLIKGRAVSPSDTTLYLATKTDLLSVGISKYKNGLRLENDTLKQGGFLNDSITHFNIGVDSRTNQNVIRKVPVLAYSNRTVEQDLLLSDWRYWRERGGNALVWYQRLFNEADNDTASQQYNGVLNIFNRLTQDHSSTRFNYGAGGKATTLQYGGVYAVNQLYPTKSTYIQPGWFGQDGAIFSAQLGIGKDSSYNITTAYNPSQPVPWSLYKADIDFNRGVPSGKSRVITGPGISAFTAGWRSHQSAQGSADSTNPSSISEVALFTALGATNPDPFSGAYSKERILARSKVESAKAIDIYPQYLPTNEAVNGYSILQRGGQDFNYFAGKVRIGGSVPDRSTGDTSTQRLEVYDNVLLEGSNNLRFRGRTTSDFPGMYWLLRKDSAGAQASIDFGTTDSRDSRGLIIGVGTSGTATSGYDNNQSGFWLDLRTGTNGAHVRRFWRNGNTVFGSSSATYKDSAKLYVLGSLAASGIARAVTPPDADSSRNLATTEWVKRQGYGTSGVGGTSNTNAGSGYRWLKPAGQEIKTAFAGYGIAIDSSSNTDGLTMEADTATLFTAVRATIVSGVNSVGSFSATSISNGASISGGVITFGPADGTNPGMISTGSQNISGTKTFSSMTQLNGGFLTGTNTVNANLWVNTASGGTTSTASQYLFGPGAGVALRVGMRGSSSSNITANYDAANVIIGDQLFVEASSGTHGLISSIAIRPPSITDNAASVSNTATVFISSAPNTTVTGAKYALLVGGGFIGVPGSETNTFRWNEPASETPATSGFSSPTNYFGANITNVLGTPHAWLRVNVNGTFYIIPAYTPFVP